MPEITYTSGIFCRIAADEWLSRSTWFSFFWAPLLLYSIGNWSLPLIDRDEPRFAEASREMRQSGDFLIPRLNGDYRFDKPPLIYWCQVLSYDVLGENDFAARFPSAIFAASGRRRNLDLCEPDLRSARWSLVRNHLRHQPSGFHPCARCRSRYAAGFLFSHRDVGRLGTVEESEIQHSGGGHSISLSVSASSPKGPAALLPVFFAPLQSFLNRAPFRFKFRSALLGGLVVLTVIGLWGIPALIATNGEYLQIGLGKHVLQRSLQPMESHGGAGLAGYFLFLPFYLVVSFFSFFPWCVFLPACVKRLLAQREPDENYLLGPILIVLLRVHADSDQVASLCSSGLPDAGDPGGPTKLRKANGGESLLGIALVLYLLIALVGFRVIEPEFLSKTHCQNRASSDLPGNANGIAQLR